MAKIIITELFTNSAKRGLAIQKKDGSIPAGFNGPYHDTETPVRNTSHYLMLFLRYTKHNL